jgi:hypothetical protein
VSAALPQDAPLPTEPPSWAGVAIPRETPRRVRLPARAWPGRLFVAALVLGLEGLTFWLFATEFHRGPRGWVPVALAQALFLAVGLPVFLRRSRIRSLVVSGEVANGLVLTRADTRIHLQRGGSVPSVTLTYVFADLSGRRFEGRCAVVATALSVGSPVPVFYEPAKPERNVPMAAVPYEIVTA